MERSRKSWVKSVLMRGERERKSASGKTSQRAERSKCERNVPGSVPLSSVVVSTAFGFDGAGLVEEEEVSESEEEEDDDEDLPREEVGWASKRARRPASVFKEIESW